MRFTQDGGRSAASILALAVLAGCGPRFDTSHPTTTARPIVTTTVAAVTTTTEAAPSTSTTPGPTTPPPTPTPTVADTTTTSSAVPSTSTTDVSTTSATTVAASTTTIDPAATIAAITANWEKLFDPASSIDDRVALLEDGETLRQAVEQRAQDPLMGQASAKVTSVELTGPDTATVSYEVLLSGAVALPNAQGTAVLQDGVWKVGAASFCALITLGASEPIPGCS
jgi:hypothetical protein